MWNQSPKRIKKGHLPTPVFTLIPKKSCTTWDAWNPVKQWDYQLSTGVGILPTPVLHDIAIWVSFPKLIWQWWPNSWMVYTWFIHICLLWNVHLHMDDWTPHFRTIPYYLFNMLMFHSYVKISKGNVWEVNPQYYDKGMGSHHKMNVSSVISFADWCFQLILKISKSINWDRRCKMCGT